MTLCGYSWAFSYFSLDGWSYKHPHQPLELHLLNRGHYTYNTQRECGWKNKGFLCSSLELSTQQQNMSIMTLVHRTSEFFAHRRQQALSLTLTAKSRRSEGDETFNHDQNQVHNTSSSGNKTGWFVFEKRPGSVCVPEKKRRRRRRTRRSVQQTHLIKQCVNGLAGWTRWGPADGFSTPSVCVCRAVAPSKILLNLHRGRGPLSRPCSPRLLTLLACKWQLSPLACGCW